jgi:hypothetical protein
MLKAPVAGTRDRLTMPCDIESRRETPERRASWHADCPEPDTCRCAGHEREAQR